VAANPSLGDRKRVRAEGKTVYSNKLIRYHSRHSPLLSHRGITSIPFRDDLRGSLLPPHFYFPSPARFTPPAILPAPSSTLVVASAIPRATGLSSVSMTIVIAQSVERPGAYRPALPVAPSSVSPTPRPKAPTTPPTVFVTPPTVLPIVEVTNLTPDVTPESSWPMVMVMA